MICTPDDDREYGRYHLGEFLNVVHSSDSVSHVIVLSFLAVCNGPCFKNV